MSSPSSALGALIVLSIILTTTAITKSNVTGLLGFGITTGAGSTKQPEQSADRRPEQASKNANERAVVEARNFPTTETMTSSTTTTTTTRRTRSIGEREDVTDGSRSTGFPKITTTAPITFISKGSSVTNAKIKTTPPSPPQQERLVGLADNTTDSHSLEGVITDTTTSLPRDAGTTSHHTSDFGLTRFLEEVSTERSVAETTIAMLTTARVATSVTSLTPGKGTNLKMRNDLVGGTFHEIKPAQKINSVHSGYFGGKIVRPNVPSVLGKYTPYFEDGKEELNMTARIGYTVILDCEIGMLGNKTVTWSYHSADVIRLLTVGRNAYSVDQRISLYFKYPTNWRLRIQYATPRDSGLYECQVATYPPLVKKIYLLVTAPILAIMDDSGRIKSGERHLKAGSALRLRCEARDVLERSNETVIWTRGDEILSEDVSENRTTEYLDGREIQVIVSTLVVEKATPRHAGNYSCIVPEKSKTTVAVHVLNGELPAAVHDGNGVSKSVLNLWLIHLTVSYVFSR